MIQAYVDRDGIQYKHTHLDLDARRSHELIPGHHQHSNATLVNSRTTFHSNSSIISGYGGGGTTTNTTTTSNIEHHHLQPRRPHHNVITNKSVGAMEAFETRPQLNKTNASSNNAVNKTGKSSPSGKLGGFFSRLASFRFSTRKSAEEKNKIKKKNVTNCAKTGELISFVSRSFF